MTPGAQPVCYYAYDRSRAGAVATTLLADPRGHLVTAYYSIVPTITWAAIISMGELFAFVRVDGLDADNNRAEGLLRPLVVQRKISGGTRSAVGSATHLGLANLFHTWHARGLNPFQECLALLHSH